MSGLKIIDFIGISSNETQDIYAFLAECWSRDLPYDQVYDMTYDKGFYIPFDQYIAFGNLLNIQTDLAIGVRQEERE